MSVQDQMQSGLHVLSAPNNPTFCIQGASALLSESGQLDRYPKKNLPPPELFLPLAELL